MNADDLVAVPLTEVESSLLRHGLIEWGGPACCTEEMALAMGFDSVEHLFREGDRLRDLLRAKSPMSLLDWTRTLLATEIVFASDVMGSGTDWSITTGLSDEESLRALRSVQGKIMKLGVRPLIGNGLGTRPRPTRE